MEFNRSCDLVNRYLLDKDYTFELIEDNTIDIDSIEELDEERYIVTDVLKKINELLKWAKQADKEIKSIKEK